MSTLTQVMLGALPVIALCILLSVFRREKKAAWTICASFILVSTVIAIFLVPRYIEDYNAPVQRADFSSASASLPVRALDAIQIAYSIADQGDIEIAREFLASARESSKYDIAFALCEARLLTLSGNDALASIMYLKAGVSAESNPDISAYAYSANPNMSRTATAIIVAQQQYNGYLLHYDFDEDESNNALRAFSGSMSDQALFSIPFVRESRLKLQVLTGDYRSIASGLSNFSDTNELIIASELVIMGHLRRSDFSRSFVSEAEIESYGIIHDKLNAAYINYWSDEPRSESESMRAVISSYRSMINNPAIGKMETMLLAHVQNQRTNEVSKSYMQIAKIQSFLGDRAKTEAYITRAIETAGSSSDSAYTSPMYELIGIIADKDSPERLKDVTFYVNEVLENSLPLRLRDDVEFLNNAETRQGGLFTSQRENAEPSGSGLFPSQRENPEPSGSGLFPSQRENAETSGNSLFPPRPETDDADIEPGNPDFFDTFADAVSETVSRIRARINISRIDAESFPSVTATITLAGDIVGEQESLREILEVYDCDVRINDYSIEKIEFSQINILLVCDTSGSMSAQSGNTTRIELLKDSVAEFIRNKGPNEHIGLLEFSDRIGARLPIGTDDQTLLDTTARFRATGGTDISGALEASLNEFSDKEDELNIILLLSDGQDAVPISENDALNRIAEPAMQKNVIIFTLGLGEEVDASYMQMFSSYTGGTYVYADSAASIGVLFTYLRDLAMNQYRISYSAVDTLNSGSRPLMISLEDEEFTYDTKYYTLDGSSPNGEDGTERTVFADGKAVYGFNPRRVTQSNENHIIQMSGEGFAASDSIRITLTSSNHGGLTFKSGFDIVYVDENTYEVTIPSGVFPGSYDVHVIINGRTAVLPSGFHIAVPGSEKVTDFGPYKFISLNTSTARDGTITLSGDVVMNGWLHFRGDVRLRPIDDYTATLIDTRGSFVRHDPSTADGALANWLANRRVAVPILPLGDLPLYNDSVNDPSSNNYQTAKKGLPILNFMLFGLSAPSIEVYPDRFVYESKGFELKGLSTHIKKALRSDIARKNSNMFKFSVDTEFGGTLSNTRAGIRFELELSSGADQTFLPVSLGKVPLNIAPSGNLKIDTYTGNYSFKVACKFAQWKFLGERHAGFGFEVSWKDSTFDSVKIYAGAEVTASIAGINVTFTQFMVGASGLSTLNPLDWTFLGGTNISLGKANTYIRGLPSPFGEAAIAEFYNTTLSLKLRERHVKLDTTVRVLGFQAGAAEIELGKGIRYSNLLLGMKDVETSGLRARLNVGINMSVPLITVNVGGSAEFSILDAFVGLLIDGNIHARVNLWIVQPRIDIGGRLTAGIATQRDGSHQFVLAARGYGSSSNAFSLKWANGRGGGHSNSGF